MLVAVRFRCGILGRSDRKLFYSYYKPSVDYFNLSLNDLIVLIKLDDANNLEVQGGPAAEGAANGPALQGSRCMSAMQDKQGQMQRLPPMRALQEGSERELH